MKTMCPRGYHCQNPMATVPMVTTSYAIVSYLVEIFGSLVPTMYVIHGGNKCMSYQNTDMAITERALCFHDFLETCA